MDDANEAMTVPQKEQNAGVALLLERMKTNPEEFTEHGKWGSLIHSHKMFLSEEDCKALDAGINALMQQHFTEKVLEELVDPKKLSLEDVVNQYRVKGMPSVGTTLGLSSGVLNSGAVTGTVTLEAAEHMKAHIEALQVKNRDELINKKPTTVFGKLFNYT